MLDRTQDLKNHRQVTVACKNYTDSEIKKSEERILSIVARNNVDFIDHINEATYRFTAPLNSKLLMLQSIAGNSNKIAPPTPSDDSVARLKTIPENTYKSQIDYIGGKTVKYNQLVQNNNFEDTSGWSPNQFLTASNNVITLTIPNDSSVGQIFRNVSAISGHKYFLGGLINPSVTSSWVLRLGSNVTGAISCNANTWTDLSRIVEATTTGNNEFNFFHYQNDLMTGTTVKAQKAICIDLTDKFGAGNEPSTVETAIPLLKANGYKLDGTDTYSTGKLKHAVVSGVKYEAVNLFDISKVVENTAVSISGNTITKQAGGYNYDLFTTTTGLGTAVSDLSKIMYLKAGTYIISFNTNIVGTATIAVTLINNDGTYNRAVSCAPNTVFTLDNDTYITIRLSPNTQIIVSNLMIVRGSTSPSTYIPYVAPITKAIPSEVLTLDGYGMGINDTLYNYVDLNAKKYYKKVAKLLGSSVVTLYKNAQSEEDWLYYFSIAGGNGATASNQIICNKLETKNTAPTGTTAGCSITSSFGGIFYVNLYGLIQTNDIATALAYIQANLEFIYPIPSVIETDISQYLTTNWNKVDLNKQYATCEMVVAEPIDMPNKVEYYGTIIHSLATAVKQDGFNIWDEVWELGTIGEGGVLVDSTIEIRSKNYINVLPNTTYYLNTPDVMIVHFWDENFNYIKNEYIGGARTYTTPTNARYMKFRMRSTYGTTYKNDICINISNQDLNGTYKPHKPTITRLLPNSEAKYSWGITDGVRNTRVFCDDEGNAVNEGSLNVNSVDMGTLSYGKQYADTEHEQVVTTDLASLISKPASASDSGNIVCTKYATTNSNDVYNHSANNIIAVGPSGNVTLYSSVLIGQTTSVIKSSVDGTPLFYGKNQVSTETLDDFDYFFDCEEGDTFTLVNSENLQCYATYSFLIKEAKSNE